MIQINAFWYVILYSDSFCVAAYLTSVVTDLPRTIPDTPCGVTSFFCVVYGYPWVFSDVLFVVISLLYVVT